MKKKKYIFAFAAALTLLAGCLSVKAEEINTITVMPYERQTIKGWGFFPGNYFGGIFGKTRTANQDSSMITHKAAMSKTVNDFGITMIRTDLMVQCGDKDGNIVIPWMEKMIDGIRGCLESGIKEYMVTAWGVPLGMEIKDANNRYSLNPDYEDNYCKFAVNAFRYIVDSGLPAPVGFSIQNEPQDGRIWCNVRGEQYIRLAKKMRKALDEAGFEDIMLLGPENAGYYQYSQQMGTDYSFLYEDPGFANSLGALITHSYYFITSGSKPEDAYRFDMNASNFPHLERWQTEFSGGMADAKGTDTSQNLRSAIRTTQILIGDVEWSGMNRWLYWNGYEYRQYIYPNGDIYFYNKSGEHQAIIYGDGFQRAKKNNIGVALSTIWKNVPVGSVVHRVWTDDERMKNSYNLVGDLIAFTRPDGNTVLVIVNDGVERREYNLCGLSGASAAIHTMTDGCDQVMPVSYRNIVNGNIMGFTAEPFSINIVVTDKEDLSAPLITIDDANSILEEDGIYIVTDKDVTITGSVDEAVRSFKINGKDVEVSENNTFSYSFDASKTTSLNIACSDKSSGAESSCVLNYRLDKKRVKITTENLITETNEKSFVLKGHTNQPAQITLGDKSVSTGENNSFEIEMSLEEGENNAELSARAGISEDKTEFSILCDSEPPVINLDSYPETVNDFEVLLSGSINEETDSFTINGENITVHEDMTFSAKTVLSEGGNEIVLNAADKYGNCTEKRINISYVKDENSPHFVNGIAYARKAKEKIKIDGDLSESEWKTDLKICRQVLGTMPANNIANFGLLWDDENLYIGAEVRDLKTYWDNQYPYLNDTIEFLLNPSNEKAGSFTELDRQVFTGPVKGDLSSKYVNKSINIEHEYKIGSGGYTVEIAVPWAEIGKTPSAGEKIGFEIVCNDDDKGGSNRDSIMTWTSETSDYYSFTSTFGTVELVNEGVFRYEDAEYKKKEISADGSPVIEVNGVVYNELQSVLDKYGSAYYDNPNTGIVNVFTSPTRKIDIKENAYQIFVDSKLTVLSNPVIKQGKFYYVDDSFEKAVFADIPAFEKYPY